MSVAIRPSYPDIQRSSRGFTLLELLVSISLISVIVLIVSLGLRTGLRAWARGKEANRVLVYKSAVEGLLARQLRTTPGHDHPNLADYAHFEGGKAELTFTTTHVPLGAVAGGVFKVVYRYYPDEKTLVYAQHLILTKEDLDEKLPEDADKAPSDLSKEGWLVSVVKDVQELEFQYQGNQEGHATPDWEEEWPGEKGLPPRLVGLLWKKGGDRLVFPTSPLDF